MKTKTAEVGSQKSDVSGETPRTWYAKTTNVGSPHEQGLVIDETTGRNVAVTYDAQDAPLIAAAPELLAVVQALVDAGGIMEPSQWFDKALAAIAKAKGN